MPPTVVTLVCLGSERRCLHAPQVAVAGRCDGNAVLAQCDTVPCLSRVSLPQRTLSCLACGLPTRSNDHDWAKIPECPGRRMLAVVRPPQTHWVLSMQIPRSRTRCCGSACCQAVSGLLMLQAPGSVALPSKASLPSWRCDCFTSDVLERVSASLNPIPALHSSMLSSQSQADETSQRLICARAEDV